MTDIAGIHYLQKCPSCKTQSVVAKDAKGRILSRRHTTSGEWARGCDLR